MERAISDILRERETERSDRYRERRERYNEQVEKILRERERERERERDKEGVYREGEHNGEKRKGGRERQELR